MTDLYIRPGVDPQSLPFRALDAEGRSWTDLANSEEGRTATGWDCLAPPRPDDTETQTAEWDAEAEDWRMVERPPAPVDPDPEPDPTAGFIPLPLLRQRAEKLGLFEGLASYLAQFPELNLKLLTLENGMVDPAYPALVDGFDAMEVPQTARDYLFMDPSLGAPDVPAG